MLIQAHPRNDFIAVTTYNQDAHKANNKYDYEIKTLLQCVNKF